MIPTDLFQVFQCEHNLTHFSPPLDSSNERKCIDQFEMMKIFIKALT